MDDDSCFEVRWHQFSWACFSWACSCSWRQLDVRDRTRAPARTEFATTRLSRSVTMVHLRVSQTHVSPSTACLGTFPHVAAIRHCSATTPATTTTSCNVREDATSRRAVVRVARLRLSAGIQIRFVTRPGTCAGTANSTRNVRASSAPRATVFASTRHPSCTRHLWGRTRDHVRSRSAARCRAR